MKYRLEKDDLPGSKIIRAIAILVLDEDSVREDFDGYIWVAHIREDLFLNQNEEHPLSIEEIRLIEIIGEKIEAEGFDKIYDEASDRLD